MYTVVSVETHSEVCVQTTLLDYMCSTMEHKMMTFHELPIHCTVQIWAKLIITQLHKDDTPTPENRGSAEF